MKRDAAEEDPINLQPCPFCGEPRRLGTMQAVPRPWVWCERCNAASPLAESQRQAQLKWNVRMAAVGRV